MSIFFLIFDEVHPEYPGFLVSQNADGSEVEGKKAERLFYFEGHFLSGHGGSVQEMLLSVSAINCLLYDSMANTGVEWEGGTKVPKNARTTFLMYAKACSGGVNTVSTDWICLLLPFILISLQQRSWLLLLISNWVDLCHFPFSILFDSSLWYLLSNVHFCFLIARPYLHCLMSLA